LGVDRYKISPSLSSTPNETTIKLRATLDYICGEKLFIPAIILDFTTGGTSDHPPAAW